MTSRTTTLLLPALLVALTCGCGGTSLDIKEPGPPVGNPVLPDLAPAPALDIRTSQEDGRWLIRFSSILVNIGKGDFALRAKRVDDDWRVEQDVYYSTSGAKVVPTPARLIWGGDGHDHWHVERIAINRLVPLPATGRAPSRAEGRADAKVGFCFYDFSRQLETGPIQAVYSRISCGDEDDKAIGMGLSHGWLDAYANALPGQSIDVTDLADGDYRLWTEADAKGWFREARRDNNVTWVDIALVTKEDGIRDVRVTKSGPPIQLQ
jgi:hypothetical protein